MTAEEILTTGTRLRLRWNGAAPPINSEPDPIGLCLPPGRQVSARWAGGTMNGNPVEIRTATDPTTSSQPVQALAAEAGPVEWVGVLRHWPVYSFRPSREVHELVRRGSADGAPAGAPGLELTLDLHWAAPAGEPAKPLPATRAEESWLRVARAAVANPRGLARFALAELPPVKDVSEKITDPRQSAPGSRPWARLALTTAGLTRLDPDELLKAGFPAAALKAGSIRLFSHGQPVALLLAPGPDAPAGLKPGVYFYAQGGSGPYSATRTYWVTLGDDLPAHPMPAAGAGLRPDAARPVETIRRTALRDENRVSQARQGTFMAIEAIAQVETPLALDESVNVTLDLPGYVPGDGVLPAEMDFFTTRSEGLGAFKIDALSDNEGLGNFTFLNAQDGQKKFKIPAHCIKNGRVVITLRLSSNNTAPGEEDEGNVFWFDRLQVEYTSAPILHAGRLTLPGAGESSPSQTLWTPLPNLADAQPPTLLALQLDAGGALAGRLPIQANARGQKGLCYRLLPGERVEVLDIRNALDAPTPDVVHFDDLTGQEQGADLLIVTHADFMNEAAALKQYREEEGWRVRLVDVQSIFDTFGDGELSPPAIKTFLNYTLRRWKGGAPGQVLLIGDCTSDYLNVTRSEVRNWVPTYTYNRGGESWASDYWFTTIAGEDNLGDMMIGRISVASDTDARTIVNKTIDYGKHPKPGPWRARLAFVADDGEFPEVVENLRLNSTPDAYRVGRVYLNELPLEDNWYLPKNYVERKHMKVSRTATEQILEQFCQGTSLLTYYGHGSPNIWADERIWFGGDSPNSDNLHLAGTGYCSFVANMTCNSGAIDYPLVPWNICITEDMMRIPGGGAIACFVPSGPGVTTVHRAMSEALGRALFDRGLRGFGEVTTLAKALYALGGNPDDLLYMYHLLGDPLAQLQLTARRGRFELRPEAVEPGRSTSWTLGGIEPAAGQWSGELVGEDGKTIWSAGPADYRDGKITVQPVLPADVRSGAATLRIVAWDPQGGADMAAAGRLLIQRPRLSLDEVRVTTDSQVLVTLSNPGRVAARGELAVVLRDTKTSRSLSRESLTLAGGESRKFSVAAPTAAQLTEPAVVDTELRLPAPPDDPAVPQSIRKRLILGFPAGWLGWIGPCCSVESRGAGGAVVRVSAALPQGAGDWMAVLRTSDGQDLTTQPLQADLETQGLPREDLPPAGVLGAAFVLDRAQRARVEAAGTVELRPLRPRPATDNVQRAPLWLAALERQSAGLRIVPGSVQVRPDRPTDGDTVFVDLDVVNGGNMESEAATVELLSRPPAEGGEPAQDLMQNGPRQIPGLAPGRSLPLTLRWDPANNAGSTTLWARLRLATGADAAGDQVTSLTVVALTKARLALGGVVTTTTEHDMINHKITIRAEVKNTGQTDAHNVMVSFYRNGALLPSGLPVPESKLPGEPVELKVVPGEGTAEAVFVWNFDPRRDLIDVRRLPRPKVVLWLKGSSQRISTPLPPGAPRP